MSVVDHIKDIYEHSEYLSAEYAISAYILKHTQCIHTMRLTDIAKGSFVSKGTVSKYMKKLTAQGTFESFQYALQLQRNQMTTNQEVIKKQAAEYISLKKGTYVVPMKQISLLAKKLVKAETVIIVASRNLRICFSPLARLMRSAQINVRFVGIYYQKNKKEEALDLKKNDVILMVNPRSTLYEDNIEQMMEDDYHTYQKDIKASVFYVGKTTKDEDGVTAIEIHSAKNEFLQREYVEVFGAQLVVKFCEYIQN